jgi:hypothetical protein
MARVLAAIAVFALVVSPAAFAQAPPQTNAPPGNSAIDEYLETIPSASGSVRPRGPGGGSGALTPALRRRLDRLGPDGQTLARLVASTSPAAPEVAPARREVAEATSASRSPAGALIAAATGQGDGGGLGPVLPAILLASLVAAGAAVVVRARRRDT